MSAEATGWVWQHSPFTGERLCVHLAIGDIVNAAHNYELWMSTGNLAEMAKCSRSTVVSTLRELVDRGMLELVRSGKDERKPSVYRFAPLARQSVQHGRPTAPTSAPGAHKPEVTQGTEEACAPGGLVPDPACIRCRGAGEIPTGSGYGPCSCCDPRPPVASEISARGLASNTQEAK